MNICDSIERVRPIGKVTCKVFHGVDVVPKKDRLKKSGFYALPDEFWLPIEKEQVTDLLVKSICFHLEGEERIIEEDEPMKLLKGLMASFPEESQAITNYDGSFECISHSFLDIAVLIENNMGVIGLICIEDSQRP